MTSTNGNGGAPETVRDPELDRARLRAVHGALSAGDIATAGKLAEDALGDGIDHPMVLNLVAGRREAEGRLDEALALLARALAAAPEAIGLMNAIGLVLSRLGRFDEAVAAFGDALAKEPGFAPALANRGSALAVLGWAREARADFEAAAAIDPANLIAADGLAALALARGEAAEARRLAESVLAREPGWPGAMLTLAGALLAEGDAAGAEATLTDLLDSPRLAPIDGALALGLQGDALDALGRHAAAFAAWTEANALLEDLYRPLFSNRPGTLASVRDLTAALEGRRIAAAWGHGGRSPAASHVFLVGFPGSGDDAIGAALATHPDVVLLAGQECLADAAVAWLADAGKFAGFCDLADEALEPFRNAYWRRVAEAGADPAGRVFVDQHVFNLFKLPLIARLFPDARVVIAGRDPRDAVLAAFAGRWRMTDPAWQMLTLEGTAALYAATMAMTEATETAFGLFTHAVQLEALAANPRGELKAVADFVGLAGEAALPAPVAGAHAIGGWRGHETALADVLPLLAPWLAGS